jgi:hypothetical protein
MTDELAGARSCPWCSVPADELATNCSACGAALAQRESIRGLVIPGVTTVDLALQAIDGQPTRILGPSPSQGMASGVMVAAVVGGPVGLAALGGMAAVAAAEYVGAKRGGAGHPENLADVGRPSEITIRALERLENEGQDEGADEPAGDPWRDLPGDGQLTG